MDLAIRAPPGPASAVRPDRNRAKQPSVGCEASGCDELLRRVNKSAPYLKLLHNNAEWECLLK
jgi:hypothetical protein